MEAGVETDRMYQALYQNERAERIALQTRAQQSLELLAQSTDRSRLYMPDNITVAPWGDIVMAEDNGWLLA